MASLRASLGKTAEKVNRAVARSAVGTWFKLEGCGHPLERPGTRFTTEVRAGLTTAAAMLYIISVNANILTNTGGPCVKRYCEGNPSACAANPDFAVCTQVVNRDYVTATSAIAFVASFLMGLLANLPLGLAPGLGVNAYFAFAVVGLNGSGSISFGAATAAVFVEGLIFFGLSLLGVRQWLARLIPRSLSLATGAGIGLFLAIIGLGPSGGLGVIGPKASDIIGLGGCPAQYKSETGECLSHVLQDPKMWLGIFLGGILTAFLMIYRVRGAFLWPILLVAIASWPRNSAVTQFPHTAAGDSAFDFFKHVVTAPKLRVLGPSNLDFAGLRLGKGWLAVITFLYVDLLDLNGTLLAMTRQAGLLDEVRNVNDFEGSSAAFLTDSGCIVAGSLMNLSPSTAFIESSAGIFDGGRTGLTGITVGLVFFLSLFFAPIFASIPSFATGSTLVIIGSLMIRNASLINWDYPGDAIPAFLILMGIPFFYNISYGSIAGIVTYIVLNTGAWLLSKLHPSLKPADLELKEPYRLALTRNDGRGGGGGGGGGVGAFVPPFVRKLARGEPRFWRYTPEEIEELVEGRRLTSLRSLAAEQQRAAAREQLRRSEQRREVQILPEHEAASVAAHKGLAEVQTSGSGDDDAAKPSSYSEEEGGEYEGRDAAAAAAAEARKRVATLDVESGLLRSEK